MTAVATRGASFWHVFLAAPGDGAVAAVPGGHFNLGLVDKLQRQLTFAGEKTKRA